MKAIELLKDMLRLWDRISTPYHRSQLEEALAELEKQPDLEAKNKGLEKRYIEAVNDMAELKRKLKNCVCPNCGFSFEQVLKEKK